MPQPQILRPTTKSNAQQNRHWKSSLISGLQRQSRSGRPRLRKCTREEDCTVLSASAPLAHEEYHILSTLQAGPDAVEVLLAVDRLLVDFEDNIAAGYTRVLSEGAGLDILHDHALARSDVQPVRHFRGYGAHRETQLALLRAGFLAAFLLLAQTSGKQLGPVRNRDGGFLFLAVADESQGHLRVRLAAGDVGHQVIAVLHRLAVYGSNGVSDFQPRLIRGTARDHVRNGHAGVHAVDARNGRILLGVELNADRATRHSVLGTNQLVVNLHHRVRGQGKTHARVAVG